MAEAASARERLAGLLGGHAPAPFRLQARRPLATRFAGLRAERLELLSSEGEPVRAILTGPEGPWRGLPAVLYAHAHGNRYAIGAAELIEGRPALLPEPYGPALAARGLVALAIDLPCFGEREAMGESALSKQLHWHGRTLFGRMLDELAGGFSLLAELDGVDPGRIGIFGFSMGATLAFWMGALEPRLMRVAHACAFADLETLVASGAHDLHGPYMTVPGLCPAFRTGEIAGLAAPRPQLAIIGAGDPLTPPDAAARGFADLRAAYAGAPDALTVLIEEGGHKETPAMRAAVLDFLGRL